MLWVKADDWTNFPIIGKGVFNSTAEWLLITEGDDKVYLFLFDESVASCYIAKHTTAAITSYENTWVHIAATYDATEASSGIKIYLNGVSQALDTEELNGGSYVAMENLGANVQLGHYGSHYANGKIADVRVYAEELTAAEVQVLASKINVSTSLGAGTTNLTAYWPIAGTSIDITDNSANSHNLTASGSPATVYDAFSVNVQGQQYNDRWNVYSNTRKVRGFVTEFS